MIGGDRIMPSIVKYTRKDGNTYAYSSIAQWDPVKKQSRPIRKYLGRVDPISGQVIPSSGKRGRPVGSKNRPHANSKDGTQGEESVGNSSRTASALVDELRTLREQNGAMQKEINSLRNKLAYYETVLKSIKLQVAKAVD